MFVPFKSTAFRITWSYCVVYLLRACVVQVAVLARVLDRLHVGAVQVRELPRVRRSPTKDRTVRELSNDM